MPTSMSSTTAILLSNRMSQVMTVLKEVITSCIYLVSDLECTQGTTRLVPRIVWHISTRSATPMTTTITLVLALLASDRHLCQAWPYACADPMGLYSCCWGGAQPAVRSAHRETEPGPDLTTSVPLKDACKRSVSG